MRKKLMIGVCLLLSIGSAKAQVTIGSATKPNPGALLDLKDGTNTGDATATKGMMLPRVKLTDLEKLKMGTNEILDTDNGGDQYATHTGLTVYNISGNPIPKCAPIPDGIYIWDGAIWRQISGEKVDLAVINISGADIYFPSGLGTQALSTPTTFNVDWSPADRSVAYTNTPHATWGGINFNSANTPPANGNLATNPTTFSLLPNAMSASDIVSNPFKTLENTLTFTTTDECGRTVTEKRVINQTSKALRLSNTYREYTANAPNTTNTLTANADWKLVSIEPTDGTTAISNVRVGSPAVSLATGVTQEGYEQNNNVGKATTLTYDITINATRARYSMLTFTDASPVKRFPDVTLSVLQCTNVGKQPTIEQWAKYGGFTQAQINDVKTTGTDSPILANGIQLHKDQSGNLYLSSNFGAKATDSDERWMIHNLAATNFDTNVTYTGGATLNANKSLIAYSTAGASESTANAKAYKNPYFGYPNGNTGAASTTTYANNPRLGLLYTWDAASAGKGGVTGKDVPTGLSEAGQAPTAANKVQGICPNGWHLPNDYEWTVLENRFIRNPKDFSTSTYVMATPLDPTDGDTMYSRGDHGLVMKEVCEKPRGNYRGTSNSINSVDRPGFDVFLAGQAINTKAYFYGDIAHFWSSSAFLDERAWDRHFNAGLRDMGRIRNNRNGLLSVRCKKD